MVHIETKFNNMFVDICHEFSESQGSQATEMNMKYKGIAFAPHASTCFDKNCIYTNLSPEKCKDKTGKKLTS